MTTTRYAPYADFAEMMKHYDSSKNLSVNFLTCYEKAEIMGLRKQQLANGAPSMLDKFAYSSVHELALAELKEHKLPFVVVRTMPNGNREYWRIEDLEIL